MKMSGKYSSIPGESEPFKFEIDSESKNNNTVDSVDINVTRENQEAKVSADQAYEDAVREMSKED